VLPALDVVVGVSLGCDGDGAVPADEVVAVDGVAGGWRDDPPLVAEKVAAAMITAPTTAPINPLNN
jgi:hypothetical protein